MMLGEAWSLLGYHSLGKGSGWWADPDSWISDPGAERNQGGLPGGESPSREQEGSKRKRPCRGLGRAGEAQHICPSRKIWSSQGPGCKAGAGKDEMGLDKDEFQPPQGC